MTSNLDGVGATVEGEPGWSVTPKSFSNQPDQWTENMFYYQIIVFCAENELFQVPALYFLGESQIFKDMFELPTPKGQPVDGSSKEHPLVLEGIRAMELQALLKVMFPRTFGETEILSEDEWEGVLKLSDMWQMKNIKELAVSKLTPLLTGDPVSRIAFSRKYNVKRWLNPAYVDLVRRPEPISVDDLKVIGAATALQICSLRERFFKETQVVKVFNGSFWNADQITVQWLLTPAREAIADSEIGKVEVSVDEAFGKENEGGENP